MKFLCITISLYPYREASSDCVYNLLSNSEVDYITIANLSNAILSDLSEVQNNIYFAQTKTTVLYKKIYSFFKNEKIARFYSKVFQKTKLYKRYTNEYMVGDLDKKRFLRLVEILIQKNKYDYIISVSMPMICHFMAKWIKEKHPELKWIAYEVDPYVYNLNLKIRDVAKRKKIASEIYKNVDYFFCMPCVKEYNEKMGYFPEYHKNSVKLELPKLNVINDNKTCDFHNPVEIIYTGIFYDKIRNPEEMLKFFSGFNYNFNLHIYGFGCDKILYKYKKILGDKLKLHGQVPKKICQEAIESADLLLVLGNTVENQVPSKIFNYFATGLPIINLYQNENDPSMSYFNSYKNSININIKNENYQDAYIRLEKFIDNREKLAKKQICINLKSCLLEEIREVFFRYLD